MAKYCLVMTPTPFKLLDSLYLLGLRIYALVHLLIYLLKCRPDQTSGLCQQITACVEYVAKWMVANGLQLNVAKTEFLCCS